MQNTRSIVGESFAELSLEEMQFVAGASGAEVDSTPTIAASFAISEAISMVSIVAVTAAAHC